MGYINSVLPQSIFPVRNNEWPATGGGLSQNGKFSYGYASSPGKKFATEDFCETRIDGVDGHGGDRAATYVKQNLFSNLSATLSLFQIPNQLSVFFGAHALLFKLRFNKLARLLRLPSSSVIACWCFGHSRGVICRGGTAIAVSLDHKLDLTDERQRIHDAGGSVFLHGTQFPESGTWRVAGVLAVSCAFGNRTLKRYVVADPEIQEEKVDNTLEFLILASDGLWDVLTNEEAVSMAKPINDPEEAAEILLQEANQRDSYDNITIVIVKFWSYGEESCNASSG